jgi:predicted ArsR family transcriptional regulator
MKDTAYENAKNKIVLAVYFAREMIADLGEERALDIIGRAYQNYSNDTFSEPYLDVPMEDRFPKFKETLKADSKDGGIFDIVEESDRHIKVKFNRCPYYEVYKDYGIPEVAKKYCDADFEAFKKVHPKLKVVRDHEIAYGDDYCDHCWILEE